MLRRVTLFAMAGLLTLLAGETALARSKCLDELNAKIAGQLLDFTKNHGKDCRIDSPSLGLKRDLYIYLPPGYDPAKQYPLLLWLHGFGGDEKQFTCQVAEEIDRAIVRGSLPPMIAAAPDGSLPCEPLRPCHIGSWFINSSRGAWEDFIMKDILGFMQENFPIRPEREARVIAGWSMGGFAAYKLGMKYPDCFRILVGCYPNLNLRYMDCRGHWGTNFDPCCESKLDDLKWNYIVGFYPRYRFPIPAGIVFMPVWGRGQQAICRMSQENPLELLDRLDIQPGQFDMFVAYGRKDEYNIDAQIDSFLHHARKRGLDLWVRCNPDGHHSSRYVNECMPDVLDAVGARLKELIPDLNSDGEAIAPRLDGSLEFCPNLRVRD